MPEGYQGTSLDEDGICNHCNAYLRHDKVLNDFENLGDVFLKIINDYRNKDTYDCILLFSGGKDSSYVLSELKDKYGLRILAFTYDWGFQSDTKEE